MARTADQIFRELNTFFNPSAKVIKQSQKGLKQGFRDTRKNLQNQLSTQEQRILDERALAREDIGNQANRRGLLFSGFVPKEEAQLFGRAENLLADARNQTAQQIADARSQMTSGRMSLAEALAGLRREQGLAAQSIFQQELDREEARRAAAASAASQSSGVESLLASLFGGGGAGGGGKEPSQKAILQEARDQAKEYMSRANTQNYSEAQKKAIFQGFVQRASNPSSDVYDKAEAASIISEMAQKWGFQVPQSVLKDKIARSYIRNAPTTGVMSPGNNLFNRSVSTLGSILR